MKQWVVKNGRRYLIKGNAGRSFQQSLNEILASEIHRMQAQQPYMEYRLIEYPVKGQFCCISEEFTSNRLEFIPAFDVINSEKREMMFHTTSILICLELLPVPDRWENKRAGLYSILYTPPH